MDSSRYHQLANGSLYVKEPGGYTVMFHDQLYISLKIETSNMHPVLTANDNLVDRTKSPLLIESLKLLFNEIGADSMTINETYRFGFLGLTDTYQIRETLDPAETKIWLSHGFYPIYEDNNIKSKKKVLDFVRGRSDNIDFPSAWVKKSPFLLAYEAEKSSDSYVYNVLKYGMYQSRRPMTRMSTFVNKNIGLGQFPKTSNGIVNMPGHFLIAVSRYGEGMSKGAYLASIEEGKSYCGTFYYWEPDSDIYLDLQTPDKVFYGNNKVQVAAHFLSIVEPRSQTFKTELDKKITNSLYNILNFAYEHNPDERDNIKSIYDFYLGNNSSLPVTEDYRDKDGNFVWDFYGAEDGLDQILCIVGKYLGYHGIILAKMAGHERVVSEILDTRDRDVSYQSLIFNVS